MCSQLLVSLPHIMCSQLFPLLLVALSLTLVNCQPTVTSEPISNVASVSMTEEDLAQHIQARQEHHEKLLKILEEAEFREDASTTSYKKEPMYTLFTDSKKNWFEAFADCRKRGLDLASIENEEEYQKILSLINGLDDTERNTSFWLSATDLSHKHHHVWMSSGHNVGFAKWAPDEPNSWAGEHCVELRYQTNHKMNDLSCNYTRNYICESRNNEEAATTTSTTSQKKETMFTLFTDSKKNWFEAFADCRKRGLVLASIENEEQYQKILCLINGLDDTKRNTSFWLSATDLIHENTYVWMSSGHNVGFAKWAPDEPNSRTGEDCVELRYQTNHKMNDLSCDLTRNYICESKSNEEAASITSTTAQKKETMYTLFTDSKKNWFEAFADCRKRGLDLASIQNEEEYQQTLSLINNLHDTKRNMSFWLSATDLIHENTFVWMSSGLNVEFAKWAPGEPNKYSGRREHCVELRYQKNHKMNDLSCDYSNNYICESRNNDISAATLTKSCKKQKKVFTLVTANKLSWYGALADCKARGLRLATVESEEEQQELASLKSQVTANDDPIAFWLSGSDLGREGVYIWMTSGQPLNYTEWSSLEGVQEPNHVIYGGNKEQCLTIRYGSDNKWNDRVCTDKHYFICDNQL